MNKKPKVSRQQTKHLPIKQTWFKQRLIDARAKSKSQIIQPRPNPKLLPLSFAQERLWFLEQYQPGNPANNRPLVLHLTGQIDITALEQTLRQIISRHEVLRSAFSVEAGQPTQYIKPIHWLNLPVVDLSKLSPSDRGERAQQLVINYVQKPFDLSQAPLLRAKLLRLDQQEHILIIIVHHIAFDAWSANIFKNELATLYRSISKGDVDPLPKLPIQYSDFAHWQRQQLQGEHLASQLAYWKKQLAGADPSLNLPTDFHRPATQTNHGAIHRWTIPTALLMALKTLSQQENVTLFMALLAAFKVLLHRYSGQQDIVIGSPIAGRFHPETEPLLGCFINTLALRTNFSQNPSFRALLHQVKKAALEAYAHQELPFEKLVEELQPERDPSRNPLFQVMFNLENIPNKTLQTDDLTIEEFEFDSQIAAFDLSLEIIKQEDNLLCLFEYNTDLFKPETIKQMARHFQILLEGIVANPNEQIGYLPLLSEAERRRTLVDWNQTQADYPQHLAIHQLFEAQVEQTPHAMAVIYEDQELSYQELNARANQLAHFLRKQGVGPEVLVGICIERSIEMVVAILGILKAGGAYVPFDPTYPQEHLDFMLEDANISLLLTQQKLVRILSTRNIDPVCLDSTWEIIAQESHENPQNATHPHHLAYVIYTSGSTGQQRAVLVPHQSLVNYSSAIAKCYDIQAQDRALQFASISFDVAVEEIFPTWLRGATVVLRSSSTITTFEKFQEWLECQQITMLNLPASFWHEWVADLATSKTQLPASIRLVIVGSEEVLSERLAVWQQTVGKDVRLINIYGPTETTVGTTFYKPRQDDNPIRVPYVPIGRPVANTQIYLLDQYLNPVPIGIPGEIYVGGDGVTRGYLNRPGQTAKRFIPNPFTGKPGARMYRTGDLARYLPSGNIEFLGRIDRQLKIRGFRVEPSEIETMLRTYPTVDEAVVIATGNTSGHRRLLAYVVPKAGHNLVAGELHSYLSRKLPAYMTPSGFIKLDALPLAPSGKIDRHALPLPDQDRSALETVYIAPRTALDQVLVNIWAEILDIETIGIYDSFFELGGHSLLATQIISQINGLFKVELPLRALFESPTVAGLVEALDALLGNTITLEKTAQFLLELTQLSDEEVRIMLQNQSNVR